MSEPTRKDILDELDIPVKEKAERLHSPQEERIIAGFEEIQNFVDDMKRIPSHGEDKGIFERLYAKRLDRLRNYEGSNELLGNLDHQGLLSGESTEIVIPDDIDRKEVLDELGVEVEDADDITNLKHVMSRSDARLVVDVATREPCPDFHEFKLLFEEAQEDIESGSRQTHPYTNYDKQINKGDFFIIGGQKAYIADTGKVFMNKAGHKDSRLRVIYDNGTENAMLMRSLKRALNKDDSGRYITDPNAGPLFTIDDEDSTGFSETAKVINETGTVYVCRSESQEPFIVSNRSIVHKIGVTRGDVKRRVADARNDPTFLMAPVQIVAEYKLYNINRKKFEEILHDFLSEARLQPELPDRFNKSVKPQEWFLVPANVIEQVIEKIQNKSITDYRYNRDTATLEKTD